MASKEQTDLMADWYDHTGFEFMGKDEVKANNPTGFVCLWNRNVQWLHDVADECGAMISEYERRL